jgi:hypothetical protein
LELEKEEEEEEEIVVVEGTPLLRKKKAKKAAPKVTIWIWPALACAMAYAFYNVRINGERSGWGNAASSIPTLPPTKRY